MQRAVGDQKGFHPQCSLFSIPGHEEGSGSATLPPLSLWQGSSGRKASWDWQGQDESQEGDLHLLEYGQVSSDISHLACVHLGLLPCVQTE